MRITAMVDDEDELLVSLATGDAEDPLAGVFRVTASECSLGRVRRWREPVRHQGDEFAGRPWSDPWDGQQSMGRTTWDAAGDGGDHDG